MTNTPSLRVERRPAPVRTQVLDNLRQAILDRRFEPGQHLIERELVELTGVSRTSIREALRALAAEGLVTTVPNKGTVVATVTADEAHQLYQVRSVLEGLAGELFVANAGDADRRALQKAMDTIERRAARGASVLEAKDRFYEILFAGAGNAVLHQTASGLHARVRTLRSLSLSLPGRAAESVQELREIMAAIEAGDADGAGRACRRHVANAGAAVAQVLNG
ncbi:GntR family transcriptional regulator [Pseudonocardia zijingensis]|jgi:DNA-binding GntR family transcriptional regulator|uniref:GntR family transcriptional regulator n=1 Tax=Pseudonocardia zijingensis TaxID=153376 RepID=A0ABP3YWD8_9PSEU